MGLGRHKASDERRNAARSRTLLQGKLIVGDALYSAECVIIDLSATGARVRVSRDFRLGPPLSLLFVTDGQLVDVAAAWRRGEEAGLVITGEHDLKTDRHPNRRQIRELWRALLPRGDDPVGADGGDGSATTRSFKESDAPSPRHPPWTARAPR
jgi:hypothetical protein